MQPRTPWTAARFLAALYAGNGALCTLGALNPMSARTNVGMLWALALTGLFGAALIWCCGRMRPVPVIHIALLVLAGLLFVLASGTVTTAGLVGLGPIMICAGVFVGHFLPRAHARLHLLVIIGTAYAGALVSGVRDFEVGWLIAVSAAIAVTEAQAHTMAELHHRADNDALTGLANRRSWISAADRTVAAAGRGGPPPTVALIDIDGFKSVNDRDGHAAGDALLTGLARAWEPQLRSSDLLARYGGDEFALLLHGTDTDGAQEALDRMRRAHPAQWSAGIAVWEPRDTTTDLLHRADEALYRDKRRSREPVAS